VNVLTGLRGGGQRCVCRADGLVSGAGRSRDRGHAATSGRVLGSRDHHVAGDPTRAFRVRETTRVRIDFNIRNINLTRDSI